MLFQIRIGYERFGTRRLRPEHPCVKRALWKLCAWNQANTFPGVRTLTSRSDIILFRKAPMCAYACGKRTKTHVFFQTPSHSILSGFSVIPIRLKNMRHSGWTIDDNRHCIASNFVVTLSAIFIDILLERFVITLASDGAPKFGAWHWEPNPDFSIGVSRV